MDAYLRRIEIAKKFFLSARPPAHAHAAAGVCQYGTGCPIMDGFLTNAEDGTPVTYANLSLIKRSLDEATRRKKIRIRNQDRADHAHRRAAFAASAWFVRRWFRGGT